MRIWFMLLTSFLLVSSSIQGQNMFTELSFEEVVEKAQEENKPFFVDITAEWCLPCQLMDETVFQDQLVQQYTIEHYLAVQLDVDDFDAMILKEKYDVETLPTILFFNSKGKLIAKEEGLQTGTNFLDLLKQYL